MIRTTVDIPEALHETLRAQSERSGASICSLIVDAIEHAYGTPRTGRYVTKALIEAQGRFGPDFPGDENPHDLIFPALVT